MLKLGDGQKHLAELWTFRRIRSFETIETPGHSLFFLFYFFFFPH